MTPNKVNEWYEEAIHGERLVYHTGLLANDREFGENYRELDMAARILMAHAEEGRVALIQRRVSPGACAYIAVRVRKKEEK